MRRNSVSLRWRDLAPIGIGLFVLFAALAIVGVYIHMARTWQPVEITVTDLRWERRLIIETFVALAQDTTLSQMPADAYNVNRYEDSESYDCTEWWQSTPTPKICWRDVLKARYYINRWVYSETIRAVGDKRDEMMYPLYSPVGDGIALNSTRIARQEADYFVSFRLTDSADIQLWIMQDVGRWQRLTIGTSYSVKQDLLGAFDWSTLEQA